MHTVRVLLLSQMGQTWGPPGSCWPQKGPVLAPWILLSGYGEVNFEFTPTHQDYLTGSGSIITRKARGKNMAN